MKKHEKWGNWVQDALSARNLRGPSEGTLRRALALGGQLAGRARSSLFELIFDSAAEPLPAGVRGAAGNERRLLYRVEGDRPCQLDLRVRHEGDEALTLTGQLLPPEAAARIEVRAGRVQRRQKLGRSGEFLIRGLPARPGTLQLEIRGEAGYSLVVPALPVADGDEDPS